MGKRINVVRVGADVDDLRVLVLSDLHVGHQCFDEKMLDYYLGLLDNDPNMRVLLLGDLHETKMRKSRLLSEQVWPPPITQLLTVLALQTESTAPSWATTNIDRPRGRDDPMCPVRMPVLEDVFGHWLCGLLPGQAPGA